MLTYKKKRETAALFSTVLNARLVYREFSQYHWDNKFVTEVL
jgi:hypothetical protein